MTEKHIVIRRFYEMICNKPLEIKIKEIQNTLNTYKENIKKQI